MPPFSQPPRPPMPGQAPGMAPRPPMPGMPGVGAAPRPPIPGMPGGAPRPPMPGMPGAAGAPRPPMPGMPGAPRPPMPGQAMGPAPRPAMPGMPQAQGGFGPRPQGAQQAGFGGPRPAGAGFGPAQGQAQGGFGPRPQGGFGQPQGGFGQAQAQGGFGGMVQEQNMDYGDNQYIKDLKALEAFYEQNKYTEILAQRYEDFQIPGWEAPTITLPRDEIYARLKYYDDIKKHERLDERQLIQVQKKVNELIKQLNYIDDYEHYNTYGNDVLSYNDKFLDENRTIHWYQRENDIKTDTGFASDISVAIPKEKWWMLGLENALNENSDDVYVNAATIPGAENDLLSHPMFTNLRTIGSNADLSQEKILVDYPETRARNVATVNVDGNMFSDEDSAQPKKKKHFWQKNKKDPKGEQKMQQNNNGQQASPGFPKKQNPQAPTPAGGFPQRQNPQGPAPTPGGFGNRPQPQAPTPGGFGNRPQQQGQGFFGYQR